MNEWLFLLYVYHFYNLVMRGVMVGDMLVIGRGFFGLWAVVFVAEDGKGLESG